MSCSHAGLGACAVASASAAGATLTADLSKTTTSIPTTMFGHIIEDISPSVEGGLNANLVRNGTLKENGSSNPPAFWSLFTSGGGAGTVALDTAHSLHAANPNALKLSVSANGAGQRVGAANAGRYYNGDTRYFTNARQMYDNIPRNGPKRLVGEYETTNGTSANPTGTLACAVSEAGFMIGMVRNADVVMGGSYAPALASVTGWVTSAAWAP